MLRELRELLAQRGLTEEVELRRVESLEASERERFLGSPTVRVDGTDVDPGAEARKDFGIKCRLYRTPSGSSPVPPRDWIEAALDGSRAHG